MNVPMWHMDFAWGDLGVSERTWALLEQVWPRVVERKMSFGSSEQPLVAGYGLRDRHERNWLVGVRTKQPEKKVEIACHAVVFLFFVGLIKFEVLFDNGWAFPVNKHLYN